MIDHLNPYAAYKDSAVLWLGEAAGALGDKGGLGLVSRRGERSRGDGSGLSSTSTPKPWAYVTRQSEASNRIASAGRTY